MADAGYMVSSDETKACPKCGRRMGQGIMRYGGIERRVATWWHCPMCNLSIDRQEFRETTKA